MAWEPGVFVKATYSNTYLHIHTYSHSTQGLSLFHPRCHLTCTGQETNYVLVYCVSPNAFQQQCLKFQNSNTISLMACSYFNLIWNRRAATFSSSLALYFFFNNCTKVEPETLTNDFNCTRYQWSMICYFLNLAIAVVEDKTSQCQIVAITFPYIFVHYLKNFTKRNFFSMGLHVSPSIAPIYISLTSDI